MTLTETVMKTIEYNHMLDNIKVLYVALSGGADSMALMHLLKPVCDDRGIKLNAIHIHHGLREASDEEASSVKAWCTVMGIECEVVKVDVRSVMQKGFSLEDAARQCRYEVFEACLAGTVGRMALGHHMDDQAETVLLNLTRGAGLKGLGGMQPVREPYIRPMIHVTKEEILDYCEGHEVPFVTDESNFQTFHRRNLLRLEVMPYLEKTLGVPVRSQLSRTADLLRDDEAFLDEETAKRYEKVAVHSGADEIALDILQLKKQPIAMQRRLIRHGLMVLQSVLKDITMTHIDDILALMDGQTGKRLDLPQNILVMKDYDRLLMTVDDSDTISAMLEQVYSTPDMKTGEWVEIRPFRVRKINDFKQDQFPKNLYTKWFDYDRIVGNLVARSRINGDYIRFGKDCSKKKLKDYFMDIKLSRRERDKVPLLCDEEEVLWIVGYRMNEHYKVTDLTKTVLEVEYIKEDLLSERRNSSTDFRRGT